jgi:energy-coupling factor transporter ATP-binding protein EcfA2
MEIEITLKNYRCFPDSSPARITVREGFAAFVGVNNSGKSSLLKFFYEFRTLFQTWAPQSNIVATTLRGTPQGCGFPHTVFDQAELFSNANHRDIEIEVNLPSVTGNSPRANCPLVNRVVVTVIRPTNTFRAKAFAGDAEIWGNDLVLGGDGSLMYSGNTVFGDLSDIFNAFREMSNTLYIGPFRNAVNVGTNDAYFDIQIGTGFITSWKVYKSGNLKAQNEACHKLTEDIKRIFGFSDLDISSSADDRSLQVLIEGKSFKLPEVGSGLTQFILVLATAAIKSPSYILIDEPELNLHPSLQLDFLTTLASFARNGIMFATHSMGLARAASDRIYSVRSLGRGKSEVRDLEGTPRLAEFLGELSFSSYKELGFETIMLVEGRTEVKMFQQFLRLLKKDHQIVLIPLGGDTLINANSEAELMELTRISNRVCAVIDSERTAAGQPLSANRQGFVQSCQNAHINCKVLERRALENYLSDNAIKKAKGPSYQALGPYQERTALTPIWGKTENWRIAREMTLTELQVTDLGEFLESL